MLSRFSHIKTMKELIVLVCLLLCLYVIHINCSTLNDHVPERIAPVDPAMFPGYNVGVKQREVLTWHLDKLRVFEAWKKFGVTGKGVHLGFVDDGFETTHPDFADAFVLETSRNPDGGRDPTATMGRCRPVQEGQCHGTPVAGAAIARSNHLGGIGTAPQATFSGLKVGMVGKGIMGGEIPQALRHLVNKHHIMSMSIGIRTPRFYQTYEPRSFQLTQNAVARGVSMGRGGLGTIYVFANGNAGAEYSSQLSEYAGIPYAMHVQGVSGLDRFIPDLSMRGSNIFISAYSSDLQDWNFVSADLTGTNGYSTGNFTDYTKGTSIAAPLVSGIVALILEANPNLTWRDVQYVILSTAKQIHKNELTYRWVTNAVGVTYSSVYGYGLIDAYAAVEKAISWKNLPPEKVITSPKLTTLVQIGRYCLKSEYLNTDSTLLTVEHLRVILDTPKATHAGECSYTLQSPQKTTIIMQHNYGRDPSNSNGYSNLTLLVNGFWGENAQGKWTLEICFDTLTDRSSYVLNYWILELRGPEKVTNDPVQSCEGKVGVVALSNSGGSKWNAVCSNDNTYLLLGRQMGRNIAHTPSGGVFQGNSVSSWYTATRINPDSYVADICDGEYSQSKGSYQNTLTLGEVNSVMFASAMSGDSSVFGFSSISTVGTPFSIDTSNIMSFGTNPNGKVVQHSNQQVSVYGKGQPGGFAPIYSTSTCEVLTLKYTGIHSSCSNIPQYQDGKYTLYLNESPSQPFTVYCKKMSDGTINQYLYLPQTFKAGNIQRRPKACTSIESGDAVTSAYYAVGMKESGSVFNLVANDVTFAKSNGTAYVIIDPALGIADVKTSVPVGKLPFCTLTSASGSLDLRGTPLYISNIQEMKTTYRTVEYSDQYVVFETSTDPSAFQGIQIKYRGYPTACRDIPNIASGNYTLYRRDNFYEVYCLVSTDSSKEYLNLHSELNFAKNYTVSLMTATFTKLRIDPLNLVIDTCDYRYSTGTTRYGACSCGASCFQTVQSNIDLSGTNLRVLSRLTSSGGSIKASANAQKYEITCSANGNSFVQPYLYENGSLCFSMQLEFVECNDNQWFDSKTGSCECLPCFYGDKCEKIQGCCGSGSCDFNTGFCSCRDSFGNHQETLLASEVGQLQCSTCPKDSDGRTCSGRGECACNNVCLCEPGFMGADCSVPIQSCNKCTDPGKCNSRGTCDPCTGSCTCESPYCNPDCHVPRTSCGDQTCYGSGCCSYTNVFGTRQNFCTAYESCRFWLLYGSADNWSYQQPKCCPPGFTGTDCKTPYCPSECSTHGTCVSGDATTPSYCRCNSGWTGSDCSTPVCPVGTNNGSRSLSDTAAISYQCSRNGQCDVVNDEPTCVCKYGWTGPNCNTPICTQQCENGGTCVGPNTCSCPCGFQGPTCAIASCSFCFSSTCKNERECPVCNNHGFCGDGFTKCVCVPPFTGDVCNQCIPGYRGTNCVKCDPCSSVGGECSPVDGKCECKKGYTGEACDKCAVDYNTSAYFGIYGCYKTCKTPPPSVTNGWYESVADSRSGVLIQYFCNSNYKLEGATMAFCNLRGEWYTFDHHPNCPAGCTSPNLSLFTHHDADRTLYYSECCE